MTKKKCNSCGINNILFSVQVLMIFFVEGSLLSVRAALQQDDTESARVKELAEKDEERKRNLQQKKRAPGDPKETALFDDRGSNFSLAGRFWSFGSNICARCWTGSFLVYRFYQLFQVWEHRRCFCAQVNPN